MNLGVVVVSTRPTRVGIHVANWFTPFAQQHGKFSAVNVLDLQQVNLPMFDEPKHPRFGDYQHDHTRRWSAMVAAQDAFVFVTPEYNYAAPPSFVNAVTYLSNEWKYKPASFVSYGGVSGGTRAVQSEKLLLTALKVMPMVENVNIPFVAKLLKPDGSFDGSAQNEAAKVMLDELHKWATALKTMR